MKTRIYTVHLSYNNNDDGLVIIKEGFCWLGFFISVPWALFHRMWSVAAIFAILQIALIIFCQLALLTLTAQVIVLFALSLVFGFLADELRRDFHERQGYQLEEVILEQNIDRATQRVLIARPELLTRMIAHP